MIKIFQTGDNHFGLSFNRYPEIREQLVEARLESLRRAVRFAEEEACDLFVVTGDLFDSVVVSKKLVSQVVQVLAQFSGTVAILPGNHDYYADDTPVWKHCEDAQAAAGGDLVLLSRSEPYDFEFNGESLTVYPAPCQSKHSKENNLGWIKGLSLDEAAGWRIGVAHGAIQGVAPDMKQEYFPMSVEELERIPMDAWLIGHVHIPYPALSGEDRSASETGRIYNAGTHEQTDLANNTSGLCFVITLDASSGEREVCAHAAQTGQYRFFDLPVAVRPDSEHSLEQAVRASVEGLDPQTSIVRLNLSGSCRHEEYQKRSLIYNDLLCDFLSWQAADGDLSEQVTMDKIGTVFPEESLAYRLLQELQGDPKELQMAYELLVQSKGK